VPAGQEYKDYKINLDEVVRQAIEVEFSGHIIEPLSFYLGYAFQDFNSLGDEPAGESETDDRPAHRVNAGLRYNLFKNTMLLLDYQFQDEQVFLRAEEAADDVWVFFEEPIDAYHLVDFGIQQTLFKEWGPFRNGIVKFYVNNVFDADYADTNGFPGTDRTFGVGLRFKM